MPAAVHERCPGLAFHRSPACSVAREARPGVWAHWAHWAGRRPAEPALGGQGPGWEAAAGGGPPKPGPCHVLLLTPCPARGLLSG